MNMPQVARTPKSESRGFIASFGPLRGGTESTTHQLVRAVTTARPGCTRLATAKAVERLGGGSSSGVGVGVAACPKTKEEGWVRVANRSMTRMGMIQRAARFFSKSCLSNKRERKRFSMVGFLLCKWVATVRFTV